MEKLRNDNPKRVLDILEKDPRARNDHDYLILIFRRCYPNTQVSNKSILNYAGMIQSSLGLYPPTERIKKLRSQAREEIIKNSHVRKKSFLQKLIPWL